MAVDVRTSIHIERPPADGGTSMELRNSGEPSGFKSVAAPLMAPALRRENRKDLRRLKALLEAAPAA